ncbi:MAG: hypothetical protein ACHQ03_11195 [Candidatus Bathyarchaeia archaeon]
MEELDEDEEVDELELVLIVDVEEIDEADDDDDAAIEELLLVDAALLVVSVVEEEDVPLVERA